VKGGADREHMRESPPRQETLKSAPVVSYVETDAPRPTATRWRDRVRQHGPPVEGGRAIGVEVVEDGGRRVAYGERDLRRLWHGARLLAELASSEAVTEICTLPAAEANPDLWRALDRDQALDEYRLAAVVDTMHATSSGRMGPANSPTTVVDGECRVLGVDGLRVADASIFPTCPRANTNLALIVIGKLVADRLTSISPEPTATRARATA